MKKINSSKVLIKDVPSALDLVMNISILVQPLQEEMLRVEQ